MSSYQKVVVLDSEDTDWCMQEADVSHQLQGHLLIKGNNEFISSSAVLSEDVANMIIPLRLITGSDHTSGFYVPAKKLLQKVIRDPEAREIVGWVDETPELQDEVKLIQKRFSCPESILRTQVLLVKISTVRHPYDDDMNHHLERTNDITY